MRTTGLEEAPLFLDPQSEGKGREPGDAGRVSSRRVLQQRKALGLYPQDKGELMRGFKGNRNM